MSTTDMADTFRQAAEVVRGGGLARGVYQRHDAHSTVAHCTVGALMAAKGVHMWNVTSVGPEIGYLSVLLGRADRSPRIADTVTAWNDEAERTAEDVITLLEQAAEKLEADL